MPYYKQIVESIDVIVLEIGIDGTIKFINNYGKKLLLVTDDIIGKHVIGTIIPEIANNGTILRDIVPQILAHPENYAHYENENITADGRLLWVEWVNKPIIDTQGKILSILSCGIDRTTLHLAREKLSFYEATGGEKKLRSIFESIQDGLFLKDKERKIIDVNTAYLGVMGLKRVDVIGKTVSEVWGDEYARQWEPIDERIWKGETVKTRHKIPWRGTEKNYELLRFPVRDMSGEIVYIGGLVREAYMSPLHIEKEATDYPSLTMQRVFSRIKLALITTAPIYLVGERGSGKSRLARYIHGLSKASGPMYSINCAILDNETLSREVFGVNDLTPSTMGMGLIELAEAGTLLVENIQYTQKSFQDKLLLFLKEGKYTKLGSDKEQRGNVRIIVCEDEDILPFVVNGSFSEELYYMLTVMVIQVPPLRERKEDIPLLIKSIVAELQKDVSGDPVQITSEAIKLLSDYSWPGNVRELRNVLERGILLAKEQDIQVRHLSLRNADMFLGHLNESLNITLEEGIDKTVSIMVLNALRQHSGNQIKAAKALGISRDTIRRHMKKHGISAKLLQAAITSGAILSDFFA
jgi:PAS domain S-box-containing protein